MKINRTKIFALPLSGLLIWSVIFCQIQPFAFAAVAPTVKTVIIESSKVDLYFQNNTLSYFRVDDGQPVSVAAEVAKLFKKYQDHAALLQSLASSANSEDRANFVKVVAPESEALIEKFAESIASAIDRGDQDEPSKVERIGLRHLGRARRAFASLATKTARKTNHFAIAARKIAIILQTIILPVAWAYLGLSFHDAVSAIPTVIVGDLFIFTVTTAVAAMTRWSVRDEPLRGCDALLSELGGFLVRKGTK